MAVKLGNFMNFNVWRFAMILPWSLASRISSSSWSAFNLNPRIIFCLQKCCWIAYLKAKNTLRSRLGANLHCLVFDYRTNHKMNFQNLTPLLYKIHLWCIIRISTLCCVCCMCIASQWRYHEDILMKTCVWSFSSFHQMIALK